jgi:general secretion pathway protein L
VAALDLLMKLRVFLPAADTLDAPVRFLLLDARGAILRDDVAVLAEMPRPGAVEAILPASRVLFARLELPRVSAATIRELLPYAVEDRLLGDPSNIHAVAGRRAADGETTVAVVDRAWIGHMLAALARSGLKPAHAWSESELAPRNAGEWHMAWGRERGLLVDDRGVSVAFDRSGAELPLALRLAIDEAAARGDRPRGIVLHPESGEPLPDLSRWSAESSVPLEAGPPWESVRAGEPPAQAIDLLQGELAPRAGLSARRIPRAALVLAAAIAVLHTGFAALDAWRLERERASLEARREALFRAAFPEAKTLVDPDLQMRRNVADLRRSRGLAGDDEFLAQLTQAARESGAPVRAVEYSGGRLQVRR